MKMLTLNSYCLLPGDDFDRIIDMDKIQECALHFLNLANTTSYVFHLANRDVRVVSLNFMPEDFHHLAELQYLTDIMIPRNKKKTISFKFTHQKMVHKIIH